MFAEEKYQIVLKNQPLNRLYSSLLETFAKNYDEVEFDGIDGLSVITEPVFVHTLEVKILNSTRNSRLNYMNYVTLFLTRIWMTVTFIEC